MTQKEMRDKLAELIGKSINPCEHAIGLRTGKLYVTSLEMAEYLIAHGVVVREKGEWVEENGIQICPFCGEEHEWEDYRASFCDQCGADMRGDTNV